MSQQNQNSITPKQLVLVVSRYGQIMAVYNRFEDAEIACKDLLSKGQPFDLSAKFVQ